MKGVIASLNPEAAVIDVTHVIAPGAGRLSRGLDVSQLWPRLAPDELVRPRFPAPERPNAHTIRGEVIHVDRFGNCITNVAADDLKDVRTDSVRMEIASLCITGLASSYADAGPGTPLAIIGSTGFLEIAASGASAAERFGLTTGAPFTLSC
jgi:S-adenosylmethionine hydrolase